MEGEEVTAIFWELWFCLRSTKITISRTGVQISRKGKKKKKTQEKYIYITHKAVKIKLPRLCLPNTAKNPSLATNFMFAVDLYIYFSKVLLDWN